MAVTATHLGGFVWAENVGWIRHLDTVVPNVRADGWSTFFGGGVRVEDKRYAGGTLIDRLDETVVAVSSAPGRSVLGIVRLTGSQAWSIAERLASLPGGPGLTEPGGYRRVWVEIPIDDEASVPAALFLFRKPNSYTREDLVEIHSVGAPPLLDLIRRRALELGAVDARPGEFTARAFLNGAMSLAEAEAVGRLIQAQTDTQLKAARRLMDGTFSRKLESWRVTLAELAALVEADIDFSEEPIDFITPDEAGKRLAELDAGLAELAAESVSAERLDALPRILLIGPPNAGKSTLMNRLASTPRSICAAVAGTTRDILAAPIRVGRCEAILLDSAGVDATLVRESPPTLVRESLLAPTEDSLGGSPPDSEGVDEIMTAARAMTVGEARRVDLLCVVLDVTRPLAAQVADLRDALGGVHTTPTIVVLNKTDLLPVDQAADRLLRESHRQVRESLLAPASAAGLVRESLLAPASADEKLGPVCPVSAITGQGLDRLASLLAESLGLIASTTMGEAIALSARQRQALSQARQAIQRGQAVASSSTETIDGAELLAFEIREALDHLGTLSGGVVTEELLDQVFATFCIGK